MHLTPTLARMLCVQPWSYVAVTVAMYGVAALVLLHWSGALGQVRHLLPAPSALLSCLSPWVEQRRRRGTAPAAPPAWPALLPAAAATSHMGPLRTAHAC